MLKGENPWFRWSQFMKTHWKNGFRWLQWLPVGRWAKQDGRPPGVLVAAADTVRYREWPPIHPWKVVKDGKSLSGLGEDSHRLWYDWYDWGKSSILLKFMALKPFLLDRIRELERIQRAVKLFRSGRQTGRQVVTFYDGRPQTMIQGFKDFWGCPKCMVYNGESHKHGWFRDSPISGNLHPI